METEANNWKILGKGHSLCDEAALQPMPATGQYPVLGFFPGETLVWFPKGGLPESYRQGEDGLGSQALPSVEK